MCAECEKIRVLKYQGYVCLVSYDHEAEVYRGACVGTHKEIALTGSNFHELERNFHCSINGYLAFYHQDTILPLQ